ncbi:MAG: inositol monophosphatase family protein [Candidatus Gracilibacteria bacterium]|jgi:fructose-1,6-bisphosphatase/inositol monophosphatase family enzyme|nr:inositol monophosphatase family protein [Candidatus Gracilibacteria bacterium]
MRYREIVESCFSKAKQIHKTLENGGDVIHKGAGFGDLLNDTEIRLDREIGEKVRDLIWKHTNGKANISVEGLSTIEGKNPNLWFCVDPLDGSLNYRKRGLSLGAPYTICVTVLDRFDDATFSNVILGANMDFRNGDTWISEKQKNGDYRTSFNGFVQKSSDVVKLDLGSEIIAGEMYYSSNRRLMADIFEGQQGYLRSFGSAAWEIASVSSGQVLAHICDNQKQHESGMGYALVKGAGGAAVNFKGEDLGDTPFSFNSQNDVIFAGNDTIAQIIAERIRKVMG